MFSIRVVNPSSESKSISPAIPPIAEVKSANQILYEDRVAEYKEKTKGLTPLYKHILWVLATDLCSSKASIKEKLDAMHGTLTGFKGSLIHQFNATQRGAGKGPLICPIPPTADLESSLHLGTTRVWNSKGYMDEERWEKLVKATAVKDKHNNDVITFSKLKEYLTLCAKEDPEEKTTGRHDQSMLPKGNSRKTQEFAAVQAWAEVYNRLAYGYTQARDPYMLVQHVREFLEDSPVAYLRAECGLLPAPAPSRCVIM